MKRFVLTISALFLACNSANAILSVPNLPADGVMAKDNNGHIDPNVDYETFMGRVSDRSDNGRTVKVHVENNNTKFLNAGDKLRFKVANQPAYSFCNATVRTSEDNYFVMYVEDFEACWGRDRYFPRGLMLNFTSRIMATRVLEASKFREILVLRKESHLKQLNEINHFLWTYNQQRIKTAAEYDEQINELQRQKQQALDNLLQRKQEGILLQTELVRKLDEMDKSLDHYKIEREEHMLDRWNLDHDSALPVGERPQRVKKVQKSEHANRVTPR